MPDNDQFARATPKARAAFIVSEDPQRMADGRAVQVDLTALAVWIEKFFAACGGLPSFAPVLAAVENLRAEPLLARLPDVRDRVLDGIEAAVDTHCQTDLDLVLGRTAKRAVLAGEYGERNIAERFFRDVIVRYAIDAKTGLADRLSEQAFSRERCRIDNEMLPVVSRAAEFIVRNPALRQLHIAAYFRQEADIATTNLLNPRFHHVANA
jgi:hypothetical protein